MEHQTLIRLAKEARQKAYAPYSGFSVGAALLTEDGRVYTGCNVENASFSPTCCAERVALFKAVSDGCRAFSAVAVVGGKGQETEPLCTPCGVCRQALAEFADDSLCVILESEDDLLRVLSLGELLPHRFVL